MFLVFLGALPLEFSRGRLNMTSSSTVKSLEDTYHFLHEIIPSERRIQPVWRLRIVLLLRSKAKPQEAKTVRAILKVEVVGKVAVVLVQKNKAREVIYCHYQRSQVTLSTIVIIIRKAARVGLLM